MRSIDAGLGMVGMKCTDVQQQLSAYYDGELTVEVSTEVASHLAGCERCRSELAGFEKLTQSIAELPTSSPPAAVWEQLSEQLAPTQPIAGPHPESSRRAVQNQRSWASFQRFAIAASILLLVGFGIWFSRHSSDTNSHHDAEFVMVMDHYLKTLSENPDLAERFLLDKYNGKTVDPDEAVKLVGYRPAVASGLPDGYTLASTSVMKMPCCTCVKAVCKRKDGSTLVLFEHDDEEAELLGDRPFSMATCGDTECCLVDLESSIAATWKRGSRWVTAVGVRDEAEIGELVTWLEDKSSSETQPL